MPELKEVQDIKIHKKFAQMFSRFQEDYDESEDTRYYLLTGGRGGMKSFTTGVFICQDTYTPGTRTLYTRYTLTSADISIIPEFNEKIELLDREEDFSINKRDIENLQTGSDIIFRGIRASSGIKPRT